MNKNPKRPKDIDELMFEVFGVEARQKDLNRVHPIISYLKEKGVFN